MGPWRAAELVGSPNRIGGGLAIFGLGGTGAGAGAMFGAARPPAAMLVGCLFLLAGIAFPLAVIATTTSAAFLVGTAVAGVGFGLAFLGAFRATIKMAPPGDRAGLIAAIYIVSYLAFSIPAVIAGAATTRVGLHNTALVYSAVIAALVAAAVGSFLLRRPTPAGQRRPAPQSGPPARPSAGPPAH